MNLLKICFITPQYGHLWSGVGTYATHLINGLADRGHETTVICPETSTRKAHPKVKIIEMQGLKIKPTLGNWFFLSYYFNKTLRSLIEREPLDIIHFVDARDSLFYKNTNIPAVGTMHDYYFVEAFKNPLFYRKYYDDWIKRWFFYNLTRSLERKAVKKLSLIITNSNYVMNSLRKNYFNGNDAKKIKTIYIGIERTEIPENTKMEKDSMNGYPTVLFVGQNFQRKGLPVLIKAIAEIKKTFPDVSLYVVGRYEHNKEEEMKNLSRGLGIEENVHFLGWKDNEEVRALFSEVDIFAMPSLIEGFGLVFLEAMNAGVPVIGGDTGGTPELIRSGSNGFLVKPGDWQDLSERIKKVIEDKSCRERFIENGYKTLERFSVSHMVEETIEVYLSLV